MSPTNDRERIAFELVDGIAIFLKNLCQQRVFGDILIKIQDGQPVLVKKEETYKPVIFLQ